MSQAERIASPRWQGNAGSSDAATRRVETAAAWPEAVVCVPTHKRPDMLRETLQSLVEQTCDVSFAVVVVDNDPHRQAGAEVAAEFFDSGALRGVCVVEAEAGNCHACNRGFREARRRFPNASYVLMIDDDEIADPQWLALMVETARERDVDIVGGPVTPQFPQNVPNAFRGHPLYWPGHAASGPVPMIYGSGNFLIRTQAFGRLARPEFDLQYNFLGGGDTDFFTRCRLAGMQFYWRQEARIVETVPDDRIRLSWILKRGLRTGAINFRIDRNGCRSRLDLVKLAAKNTALIPVSAFRSLKLLLNGQPPLVSVNPMVIALGRILAWLGLQPEQYRFKARKP